MRVTTALLIASAGTVLALHAGDARAAHLRRALQSDKALSMVGVRPNATPVVSDAGDVLDGEFKNAATMGAQTAGRPAPAIFGGTFATSRLAGPALPAHGGRHHADG